MTKTRNISPFSEAFARHLHDFMQEEDITGVAVAERMGRSNAYVSEHIRGVRPPESDLLDTVALLAGISTRKLVQELLNRMEPPREPS